MFPDSIEKTLYALRTKQFSVTELTQHYLNRIANDSLNCFITVDQEGALEQAKKADQLLYAKDGASPLLGIPIAHKDLFCTKGIRTTCASLMLSNFIAPYDAHIVSRCKKAGMLSLGKTNMDEFAMGSSNETSYFGMVSNPWDGACVPGGSSGGSAAAVASGLVLAATGSDTGGSIRQPASFCGITGLKPTYGLASRYGMIAFASSLDQAGPMARSAEDITYMLSAMAGFDESDSTSVDITIPDYTKAIQGPVHGLRLGIPKNMLNDSLSSDMQSALQDAITQLEKLGMQVIEIDLPHLSMAVPVYTIIAFAECSSNLARYDGVRYGYSHTDHAESIASLYKKTRSHAFGKEVKRRILLGAFVLSSGYYDAYYSRAQKIRRLIADDFAQAFEKVDAIFQPTTPTAAFKQGEKTKDPIAMYLSDIYTVSANLAGIPALSFPIGHQDNLPLGGQILGKHFSEPMLLKIVHQFQQASAWHKQKPSATSKANA